MTKKRLILRLSSLGDVILASSALEALDGPSDWAVSPEYTSLLQNHPKIHHILEFNRKSGLRGWVLFCRDIWDAEYDEIFDLHRSLRTWIMRVLFLCWNIFRSGNRPLASHLAHSDRNRPTKWNSVSKQRGRLFSLYLLKSYCPKKLRPTAWVSRFALVVGGSGNERPNLKFLTEDGAEPIELALLRGKAQGYLCIMPSSRWEGKMWPVDSYVNLIKNLSYFPVIMGTHTDIKSIELIGKLQDLNVTHFSGVGKWNLRQTAHILRHSQGYFGGDTGLAHLAESVGVPARTVFGPTSPDMGFGPWREESKSVGVSLGCRPCGKDGRYCFRTEKYSCLKQVSPEFVLKNW